MKLFALSTLFWLLPLGREYYLVAATFTDNSKIRYTSHYVSTKYGDLRGMLKYNQRVEVYLGIPYATPPLYSARYMPPITPNSWKFKVADKFGPACPQRLPDISNRTEALLQIPRQRLAHLEKLLPLLTNQSEDCLYINLYVPRNKGNSLKSIHPEVEETVEKRTIPCVLIIHGESFEWSSGNLLDGSGLAIYGNVIVATISYRLGVLGFLKTGTASSRQGNNGIMDLIGGLHFLKEILPGFGGDPNRISVLGHGTGAALANIIAISPISKGLVNRVLLFSGSAMSQSAIQMDPMFVKRKVAEHTGCHGDLMQDDMGPCLSAVPVKKLLGVTIEPPRFLPGFAPFLDGILMDKGILELHSMPELSIMANTKKGSGYKFSDFSDIDLMFGLTSFESYLELSAQDLEFGILDEKRDKILRTFVRNCFRFHLNEIYSTLKNEYTEWERPYDSPFSHRDAIMELLSDGYTASALIKVGHLHSVQGGRSYFVKFHHQLNSNEFPQKKGSVHGEDIPFILGFPLIEKTSSHGRNYTEDDIFVSQQMIHYISNFVRTGNPNGLNPATRDLQTSINMPIWEQYNAVSQQYLELDSKSTMKSHYRGHKMSMWMNLVPQLHKLGSDDMPAEHNRFKEDSPIYYEGRVRPQIQNSMKKFHNGKTAPPSMPTDSSKAVPSPTNTDTSSPTVVMATPISRTNSTEFRAAVASGAERPTECPSNQNNDVSINSSNADDKAKSNYSAAGAHNVSFSLSNSSLVAIGQNNLSSAASSDSGQRTKVNENFSVFSDFYSTNVAIVVFVGSALIALNVAVIVAIFRYRRKNVVFATDDYSIVCCSKCCIKATSGSGTVADQRSYPKQKYRLTDETALNDHNDDDGTSVKMTDDSSTFFDMPMMPMAGRPHWRRQNGDDPPPPDRRYLASVKVSVGVQNELGPETLAACTIYWPTTVGGEAGSELNLNQSATSAAMVTVRTFDDAAFSHNSAVPEPPPPPKSLPPTPNLGILRHHSPEVSTAATPKKRVQITDNIFA